MYKRIVSLLMAAAMTFGSAALLPEGTFDIKTGITASAEGESSGVLNGEVKWELENGVLTLSRYDEHVMGLLPSYDKGKSPFYGRTDITSVVIMPSVQWSIGSYLFEDCKNLSSVTIPDTIDGIGEGAFSGCKSLEGITLSDNIYSIGKFAFTDSGLKSITIPKTITYIQEYAFSGCTSLEEVNIPDSVTRLDRYAFAGCTGLKDLKLPSSIETIGRGAFTYCPSVTEVTLPEGVKSIGENAFENCYGLKKMTLPSTLTSIGPGAFRKCQELSSINLPNNLKSIGFEAFEYCRNITSITLPNGLKTISNNAFSGTRITSITIPDSMTKIDDHAFSNCGVLTSITIPSSVETIGAAAFSNCHSLEKIVIPKGVKTIGSGAFGSCSSLKDISISNTVTLIADGAFQDCNSIKSITIPRSVKTLGRRAFYHCWGLTSFIVPNGVETIGEECFAKCKNIKSITIPGSVKSIGNGAFSECSELTSMTLPKGITSIGASMFKDCTKIRSITIPSTVTSVGNDAFNNCTAIKSLTLPSGVTSIGNGAFYNCTGLKDFRIPGKVTSIGDRAFYNCTALTGITIPSGVTSFGIEAFYNCMGLKSINIPKLTNTIGDRAFYLCTGIKTVTFPDTPISIGNKAFGFCKTNGEETKLPGFLIRCYWNSSAENYAKDNGLNYEIADAKHHAAKKATCTQNGNIEYWTYQGYYYSNGRLTSIIKKENIVTKATGHRWGAPTYTWSADNKTCTASRVCKNNKNHVQTETVSATAKTAKATCTTNGSATYTATFKNAVFKPQTKKVTLKATAHKLGAWRTTGYNVDKKTAVQTRKCLCGKNTETKVVKNAVVRYAGSDRAQTASLISSGMYKTADTVVLATGFDFHDALAAVPLASAYNAPLLLADRDNISAKTLAEIKRLKAKNVIVVASTNSKDQNGNDAAIKRKVYDQLKTLGVKVTKLVGNSYYETAKKVAQQLQKKTGKAPNYVFFTTDKNYADALSVSPVAAILKAPVFYVDPKGKLNANTTYYLKSVKSSVKKVFIVGGTNAVSNDVVTKIKAVLPGKTVQRFDGADRYATCVRINNAFKSTLTGDSVCIAKGYNFPDALAGGVFAAKNKAPLFLADKLDAKATISKTQANYLYIKNPSKLYIFGGENAVPTALVKTISKACV